ncbi:hypothetical protein [Methanobrevibacter filiformis]|uniref:Ribbon-helix-helix protein CopG domain-containing protein n=1 Tax=Methanobrevibacter filiformis TaxID=55758 RepID=A0A165ZEI8_9EURY|nr:hypothetical protein [Methanobrevibacter filiformis]KZX10611.1 hypothetical protein MBFIL_17090 [Methanobrevibacter filiformis]
MSVIKTIKIKDSIFQDLKKLAEKENKSEETIINESLEKTISENEIFENRKKYPDGIPIEIFASEFGETPEEFKRRLEKVKTEESIKVDINELKKELDL